MYFNSGDATAREKVVPATPARIEGNRPAFHRREPNYRVRLNGPACGTIAVVSQTPRAMGTFTGAKRDAAH